MLCHLDFHPDQVMLTTSSPVVIDWMNARAGDPAADVAYTLIMLTIGSAPDTDWFKQQLIDLLRGIFSRTYLRHYFKVNPSVTRKDIDAWTPLAIIARIADGVPGGIKSSHSHPFIDDLTWDQEQFLIPTTTMNSCYTPFIKNPTWLDPWYPGILATKELRGKAVGNKDQSPILHELDSLVCMTAHHS